MLKAPVQVFGIDGKYATALYSAAVKEKQLDAVEKDLRTFEVFQFLYLSNLLLSIYFIFISVFFYMLLNLNGF